jgi:hypothetical protein
VFNWRTAPVSEGAVLRMSGERDPP